VSRGLSVVIAAVSSPGYRSLAAAYLSAALTADPRMPDTRVMTLDLDTRTDAWWIAYRILRVDPAPDIVAFPVLCWTARTVYETARIVKAARPATRIVMGGPEVGPIARSVLDSRPFVDAIVRGEGEFAFADLVFAYSRGGDPGAVPGVVAREGDIVVQGPERPPIEDLDAIASAFVGRPHATDGSAFVETYRGCPHMCAYCFEGKGSTRIRSFSWDRIAADIEAVASVPGMRSFSFIDPVFNLTPSRLRQLSDIMAPHAERGIRLHTIEVDIERVDDEAAELLRRAGVESVETGPQSIGERALETCRRSFDPARFAEGVQACRRAGISVECDLIVGLPGDTCTDVMDGIDFAIGLDPGKVQISTLHVLPGTHLWDAAAELGLAFDPEPPHELISTRDIDYVALRRLEAFGVAASRIYRARITADKE